MLKKATGLVLFLASSSLAKTDTFNMTLTGDISKDYCEINLTNSVTNDVVAATLSNSDTSAPIANTTFTISCSPQTKHVGIYNSITPFGLQLNSHTKIYQTAAISPSNTAPYENSGSFLTLTQGRAASFNNIQFSSDNDFIIDITTSIYMSSDPTNGLGNKWLSHTPDSFNESINLTFVISDTPFSAHGT